MSSLIYYLGNGREAAVKAIAWLGLARDEFPKALEELQKINVNYSRQDSDFASIKHLLTEEMMAQLRESDSLSVEKLLETIHQREFDIDKLQRAIESHERMIIGLKLIISRKESQIEGVKALYTAVLEHMVPLFDSNSFGY